MTNLSTDSTVEHGLFARNERNIKLRFLWISRQTGLYSELIYKNGRGRCLCNNIMSDNEHMDGKAPLFLMAGVACLLCLLLIYLVTRPLIWLLQARWAVWPLFTLWTLIPVSVAFAILYRSDWHREWPRVRRIFSMILSSCIIVGVDLLVLGFLVVMGCLIMGLGRVMGGN